MTKVLVTGATGWLGSYFVDYLIKNGYNVRCLVLENDQAEVLEDKNVEIVRGDITKPKSIENITEGVSIVYHTAALQHASLFNAYGYFKVNTQGTKNLLKESINNNVDRFVYVSSDAAAEPEKK